MKFNLPISAILTTYILICGFAYLWGYWDNFDIEIKTIIQLLDVADIIKASILPMLSIIGLSLMHSLITYSDGYLIKKNTYSDYLTFKEKKSSGYKILFYILFTISGLTSIYYLWKYFDSDANLEYYKAISVLVLSSSSYFIITNKNIIPNINANLRLILLYSIIMLPALMLDKGALDGNNIKNGKDVILMVNNSYCSNDKNEVFYYLATYGGKGVSYSPSNDMICIFTYDNLGLKSKSKLTINVGSQEKEI
ncbi:hypothetical protein ACL2XO_04900 [Sodalis sp. RH15]|uniref:hypothetical protein n=1 Tax=Sodalis sp. RH15 TaxID=3394330 RepID=UPI0039B6E493